MPKMPPVIVSPSNTMLSVFTEPAIFDGHLKAANSALQNPAVARCCQAWQNAYQEYALHDESQIGAREWACKAYRNAMPVLSGQQDVNDYIACISHGLLIGAIKEGRASKLLYAVQVALTASNLAHRAKVLARKTEKRSTPSPLPHLQQTVENVENLRPEPVELMPVKHTKNKASSSSSEMEPQEVLH